MATANQELLTDILNRLQITPEDLWRLEHNMFSRGVTSADEAETLIHLQDVCAISAPNWTDFYTTSISEFFVDGEAPKGKISDSEAIALIIKFASGGTELTDVNFEILLKTVERAEQCPDHLILFLLEQVKQSAFYGSAILRETPATAPPSLEKKEVDVIRRILFPLGPGRHRPITQRQVAFLMDFNAVLDDEANHPSWTDTYIKAVSQFALETSSRRSREAQLRSTWRNKPSFLSRFTTKPNVAKNNISTGPSTAETTTDPVMWFTAKVKSHKELDKNTAQLLKKLKKNTKNLHSSIADIVSERCKEIDPAR